MAEKKKVVIIECWANKRRYSHLPKNYNELETFLLNFTVANKTTFYDQKILVTVSEVD